MIPKQRMPVDDDDDPAARAATLDRAIAGDREAFGEIWRTYNDQIYRFVRTRTGNHATAEEITSETFTRALRNIGSFVRTGAGIAPWLITIARNLITDLYKSSRHQREVTIGGLFEADRHFLAGTPAPGADADVLLQVLSDDLRKALGRLNDHQRECIIARYLEELSVAETATRIDRKEGAVKTLTGRALAALARDLTLIGAVAA